MEPKSAVWERAVFELSPQSEKLSSELVMASYVDVGHLQRLRNGTSQLVEGRRGTGKTHLLTYFCQSAQAEGIPALFVDARALRLESGPDASSPKHLARGLYRELVEQVARQLEQFARTRLWQNPVPSARGAWEVQVAAQTEACLLRLRELANVGVAVRGPPRRTEKMAQSEVREAAGKLGAELTGVSAEAHLGASATRTLESSEEVAVEYRLSFSDIGRQVEEFLRLNDLPRCYLCIDEWSSIPLAAQPHFAEHLKRTFFPSAAVALKIGTLPFQTRLTATDGGQPIGFERNGDVFLGIDLDDDLVFFRKEERSYAIFSRLLHNHLSYALRDEPGQLPGASEETIDALFTEKAFPRLLAYAQGNPRDFLTLFRKAYLSFKESPVPQMTAPHVDAAAKEFGLEKIDSIQENPRAFAVFNRVVSEVLHTWKSNGFLVETELGRDETLLFLVHNRVLHVWDRSYSSPSHAGRRFLVLSIDFCILSEHLRSPSYRHIWEEVEQPLALESAVARRERQRLERLAALEPPDKRVARYHVLAASFFEGPELVTCPSCGAQASRKHPVVVKLSACPSCGEKL